MPKPLPSREYLCKILRYDDESGKLYWRERSIEMFKTVRAWSTWNARYSEKEAGTAARMDGYLQICINDIRFVTHRIVWALHNDEPPIQIDHKDGVRTNNRICNLSSVSHRQNGMNRVIPQNNTSGHMGVYFENAQNKWRAQISVTINGESKCLKLGSFATLDAAIAARKAAEIDHGFHINHGKRLV